MIKFTLLILACFASPLFAQSQIVDILKSGLSETIKQHQPLSAAEKKEVLTVVSGALTKRVKFRTDGLVSAVCSSTRRYVQWKGLVVRDIRPGHLSNADKLNGISRRYSVTFGSAAHRTWDSKSNAWTKWHNSGYSLFPSGVTVEEKNSRLVVISTSLERFTPGTESFERISGFGESGADAAQLSPTATSHRSLMSWISSTAAAKDTQSS